MHKDDIGINNRSDNLYYGDDIDNAMDRDRNGINQTRKIVFDEITAMFSCGEEDTYDISVDHEFHNFFGNKICTHNSYNELSARYKELPETFYVPELDQITTQSTDNKQMRTNEQNPNAQLIAEGIMLQNSSAFAMYHDLLKAECPREIARSVLPVGTYSHMFATMNLHNLFRFLSERLHPHAQYEIRVYAEAILKLIEPLYPVAVGAFKKSL